MKDEFDWEGNPEMPEGFWEPESRLSLKARYGQASLVRFDREVCWYLMRDGETLYSFPEPSTPFDPAVEVRAFTAFRYHMLKEKAQEPKKRVERPWERWLGKKWRDGGQLESAFDGLNWLADRLDKLEESK